METPTISKKQSKKTLSGKKKKTEVIKNVLAKPYQNYWPLLSPEDNNHLKEILERLLPRLKNDKINIPYKEIKGIPKDERKKFRETYAKQAPITTSDADQHSIIFGVNDISKTLENLQAGSVLVASDAQPRLLVQHILDQAVLYNVPVLVMQDLRTVFKSNCGLSGVAVAFKQTIEPNSKLGLIQQTICNIYENYPVPEQHINYHRKLDMSTITILDSENESAVSLESDLEEVMEIKNYHLKKETSTKRAFIPENAEEVKETIFINLDSSSCQSLNPPPVKKVRNIKTPYRPLAVKRLKGDKNRNKRKMEKFKKKKNRHVHT